MVQATFNITAVLDTPIEDVWAFVSDVTNQDHWVAGMSGSGVVGGGAIGVGSEVMGTSRFRGRDDTLTVEVTEFDPPRRVSWRSTSGGAFPFITQIVLTARGEQATGFSYDVTTISNSMASALMMGPLRPVMGLISSRMLREEVTDLRAALDAAAAG